MVFKDSTSGTPGMQEAAKKAYELAERSSQNPDFGGGEELRLQEVKDFPESLRPELEELIKIGALKGNDGKGGKLDFTVAEARTLIIAARVARSINN